MEVLLPQALLVYDPEVARREFQVLAKLVQQSGLLPLALRP